MLYHLLYPLHTSFIGFNVFRYITFRSICGAITAFLIMIVIGPWFIRKMQKMQIGQVVRDDGPASHLAKQGVPTMGGVLILSAIIMSTLCWARLDSSIVWLLLFVIIFFGFIGGLDDYRKISKKSSDGLSARGKLFLQFAGAAVVGLFVILHPGFDGHLSVPFLKNIQPDLGWFYIIFTMLVIVGASNAVNLTDGLDGLATGPTIVSAAVYLSVFCGAMVGACLGFLWFNAYPAQMFMGDVGSLALGGSLGAVAVIIKQEMLLAIVGGIFVMEAVSVIMQVGYFKLTKGRRIFLMAPFHHHYEKKGWHETKVVVRFWIVSIILGFLALATLKHR